MAGRYKRVATAAGILAAGAAIVVGVLAVRGGREGAGTSNPARRGSPLPQESAAPDRAAAVPPPPETPAAVGAELQDAFGWKAAAADLRLVRNLFWKFRSLEPALRLEAVAGALGQLEPPARVAFLRAVALKLAELESAQMGLAERLRGLVPADRLAAVRELRRSLFGPQTADALFAEEDKLAEYGVRVEALRGERPGRSLEERQREAAAIGREVFGDDAEAYLPGGLRAPFERKLGEIAPDWDRMSEPERADAVHRARVEAYGAEAAGRLEALDRERAARAESDSRYEQARADLDGRADLSPEEKGRMIDGLRRETFGEEEADKVARREAIHALTQAHAPRPAEPGGGGTPPPPGEGAGP